MTLVDLIAASAASVASFAIGVRARMLRPRQRTWSHAPPSVWLGLSLLALCLLMIAVTLWSGARASTREAVIYSVLAVVSLVMLWNLNRHGRMAEAARRQLAEDIRVAMDASGPPKPLPWDWPT